MAIWADYDLTVDDSGTPTTTTATLPGGAPASTHTLVAVLTFFSAGIASNSWGVAETLIENNGSAVLVVFMKQGDSTTNNFTVTWTADTPATTSLWLFSFPGFVSLTPDKTISADFAAVTGDIGATAGPTLATTNANTIALAIATLSGSAAAAGVNWGDWDNLFTEPELISISSRGAVGVRAYTTAGQTPQSQVFWDPARSRAGSTAMLAIQGTSADAGGTTPVTKSAGISWDVRAPVTKTAAVSWDIRSVVTKAAALSWNVRTIVSKAAGVVWDVRALAERAATLVWDVRALASNAVPVSWALRAEVSRALPVSWNVRQQVSQSTTISWAVRALVTIAATILWAVRSQVSTSAQIRWNVESDAAPRDVTLTVTSLTARWSTTTLTGRWSTATLPDRFTITED